TLQHVGVLEAGAGYSDSLLVTWPADVSGLRWLAVASDLNATARNQIVLERGDVFENQNEHNFGVADSTDVAPRSPPDLIVSDVGLVGTGVLASGGTFVARWSVANIGFSSTTAAAWSDRVYLSTDSVFDASDVQLGQFP